MKKLVTALAALTSLASAQSQDITIAAADAIPSLTNYLGLTIRAYNPHSVTKRVRINYELPAIEEGVKYNIDNVGADSYAGELAAGLHDNDAPDTKKAVQEIANCKLDPNKVDHLIYNIKQNAEGTYFLDAQFELKPQDDKTICFPIARNDVGIFEDLNEPYKKRFSYTLDEDGSPLQNKIVYNYIPRPRASYVGADLVNGDHLRPGSSFTANVMSGGSNPNPESSVLRIWDYNKIAKLPAKNLVDIGVEGYGMYKDTRMLIANVGPLADYYRWNESTFDGHMYNGVEERVALMGRCWLIAVFNIYSKLYGNRNTKPDAMTQDEMLFRAKTHLEGTSPQFELFRPNQDEGGDLGAVSWLINDIMPGSNATWHYTKDKPLDGAALLAILEKGTPIPFTVPGVINNDDGTATLGGVGHLMLIDGLAITEDNYQDTLVHIINTDNYGNDRYVFLNALRQYWQGYALFDKPYRFEKTDNVYPVDTDTDYDGIVDFDEHYRFMSNPDAMDSDRDRINDMDEIYAYVSRMHASSTGNKELGASFRYQFTTELTLPYAFDYTNPKTFPQMNDDYDGDGLKDWEEDLNKNGIYEPMLGETDPFVRNDTIVADIPSKITFYAFETINLGNDVFCFSQLVSIPESKTSDEERGVGEPGCNIASSLEIYGEPVINIGKNVKINQIHSMGSVQAQDGASLFMISMYNNDAWVDNTSDDNSEFIIHKPSSSWPFNPVDVLPKIDVGTQSVIVEEGDTLIVNDGDKYASVEVKNGGSIHFNDGEMHIGSIKLAYNSSYTVQGNGYSTILHLNGPVEWYAKNAVKTKESIRSCNENKKCGALQKVHLIAKSFKVYQHSNKDMYIDTRWLGTIIAPDSKLHLGIMEENSEIIAGQFLARDIDVLPDIEIYHAAFEPLKKPADVEKEETIPEAPETEEPVEETLTVPSYSVASNSHLSIVSMNRNELMFETASANRYQVFIAKANGAKAAAYTFDKGNVGINFVSLADAKLTRGNYFVTIKQNGRTSSKMLVIK